MMNTYSAGCRIRRPRENKPKRLKSRWINITSKDNLVAIGLSRRKWWDSLEEKLSRQMTRMLRVLTLKTYLRTRLDGKR